MSLPLFIPLRVNSHETYTGFAQAKRQDVSSASANTADIHSLDPRGLMIVMSSPSGGGKSSLCRFLLERHPSLKMSVSMTTRAPRLGEKPGHNYHYVSEDDFLHMKQNNAFIESATVFGHHYGTPKEGVEDRISRGLDVLFDVDWQGAEHIAKTYPHDVVLIFILPPSLEILAERLRKRGQDSSSTLEYRMSRAHDEISHYSAFDYLVVNDDLTTAADQLSTIVSAERLKRVRHHHARQLAQAILNNGNPTQSG